MGAAIASATMELHMTDQMNPTPSPMTRTCSGRRGKWKIAALVLVSAFAGAAAAGVMHHWHMRHAFGMFAGPIDPAEVDRRVEHMTDRLAGEVSATPEQREKLTTIAKSAAHDMLPMRDAIRQAHIRARDLLAAPSIDRDAIEKLRSEESANFDTVSKRLSAALADAAEVLTPDQRRELEKRMPLREGWRPDAGKG